MATGMSDAELMKTLDVDAKTLARFREIQRDALAEAKRLNTPRKGKIRVLGVSGSARDKFDEAREDPNSEDLLEKCLARCRELGAETDIIKLRKYRIEHCKCCYSTTNLQCHFYCSCYPKGTKDADDMSNIIYDKILWADAIILATPVNNFKVSTLMAAFMDRCISLDGSLQPADPKDPKNKALNTKHMKFVELVADQKVPGSGTIRRFVGKVGGALATGHEEGASMALSCLFMTFNHYGLLFPPYSTFYAMASPCNQTYADKPIVLNECHFVEARMLAENIVRAAELARKTKVFDWQYEYDRS